MLQQLGEAYETYKDVDPFSPSWEGLPLYGRPSPQSSGDKKKK